MYDENYDSNYDSFWDSFTNEFTLSEIETVIFSPSLDKDTSGMDIPAIIFKNNMPPMTHSFLVSTHE